MTRKQFLSLHRTLGPDFLVPRDSPQKTQFVRAYWRRSPVKQMTTTTADFARKLKLKPQPLLRHASS